MNGLATSLPAAGSGTPQHPAHMEAFTLQPQVQEPLRQNKGELQSSKSVVRAASWEGTA